jgi:transcriptional regulator with XRE-family HTH domain
VTTWEPTWPGRPPGTSSLAARLGVLRTGRGWTQQQLADRLGISRVAVSHLEAGINSPDARTVTLLAGAFGLEPHDLVAGTDYPPAKADRLPLVVARHTEVTHQVALMEADLAWIEGPDAVVADPAVAERTRTRWRATLSKLAASVHDPEETARLTAARRRLDSFRGPLDGTGRTTRP